MISWSIRNYLPYALIHFTRQITPERVQNDAKPLGFGV